MITPNGLAILEPGAPEGEEGNHPLRIDLAWTRTIKNFTRRTSRRQMRHDTGAIKHSTRVTLRASNHPGHLDSLYHNETLIGQIDWFHSFYFLFLYYSRRITGEGGIVKRIGNQQIGNQLSGSYKERLYISRMGMVDCYRNRLSWSFGRIGTIQSLGTPPKGNW